MTSRRVIFSFLLTAFFLLISATSPVPALGQQSWTIQTFAGGGPNNIPASGTAVGLGSVSTDSDGTLFISGGTEGEIWKVLNGNLLIVAGAGVQTAGQSYSYAGDGGAATAATVFGAGQVAFDQNGNFFIPDSVWNRVRKVDRNGIITLLAGDGVFQSGKCVFDGDGPATQHTLCQPISTAVDAHGNVYVSDHQNNRVRKVDAAGNMTTFAGDGALNVYGQCVFDGDGPATQHALCSPQNIVFDSSGNLYIADYFNYRIRKVDSKGNMTTVAGNGSPGFSGDGGQAVAASISPVGVAFDVAGNMYIGDSGNSRVRKVNTSGIINTIAGNGNCTFDGDGPALQHSICFAYSLALDSSGNVYVADANSRVRMVDPQGTLTTVAGNGTTFDSGNGGPATQQPVYNPYSVTTDPVGNVYAKDCYAIRKIDLQGNISPLTGNEPPCQNPLSYGLAVDGSGNTYYTTTTAVFKQNSQGTTAIAGTGACTYDGDGPATQHSVCNPEGLVVDTAGNVFIADTDNNLVRKVDTTGNMVTIGGYYYNAGLGCYPFDGDGPATSHKLCSPWGLAIDASGNIYLSDSQHLRVRVISQANGTITTIAGNGMYNQNGQCIFDGDGPALQHSLCVPTGVAVLPSGNVFVVDSGSTRVREISGGTMNTIAGNGISGFGGDGGPATAALLDHPTGLAADSHGAVYISDTYNNRVRRLTAAAATTTTLASSPNPSHIGQTVLLTAKVTASAGTPTGNLTFYDGATPLRMVVLNQGAASMKISSLSPGIHSLTASYAGNGTFASSTSGPLSQTVNKAMPSVSLLSTPNPSKPNQQVTFAVVASGKAGVPTGSITLKQGTKILGTATLASGDASFVVAFSKAGTYTIVAHYSGDQNYNARNSIGLKQVVN
jgi:sugar lactone lactonase YvrE